MGGRVACADDAANGSTNNKPTHPEFNRLAGSKVGSCAGLVVKDAEGERRQQEEEQEAHILRVVFQGTEFEHEGDIEALCDALQLSLRNFSPTWHTNVKEELDAETGAAPACLPAQTRQNIGQEEAVTHDEAMMRVRDLRFTHDSVAGNFWDGRNLERLVQDLRTGLVDPMVNLKPLKVYHWPGRGFYIRDNRSLKCLKEYQSECGDTDVFVRVNVLELPAEAMKRIRSP